MNKYLLTIMLILQSCGPTEKRIEGQQIHNIQSPNKLYKAILPIRRKTIEIFRGRNQPPKKVQIPAWIVTFKNQNNEIIYEDLESRFIGSFNVYWGWDKQNNFWLYNSDDGRVWKWSKEDTWNKASDSIENIPTNILPGYARKYQKRETEQKDQHE